MGNLTQYMLQYKSNTSVLTWQPQEDMVLGRHGILKLYSQLEKKQ